MNFFCSCDLFEIALISGLRDLEAFLRMLLQYIIITLLSDQSLSGTNPTMKTEAAEESKTLFSGEGNSMISYVPSHWTTQEINSACKVWYRRDLKIVLRNSWDYSTPCTPHHKTTQYDYTYRYSFFRRLLDERTFFPYGLVRSTGIWGLIASTSASSRSPWSKKSTIEPERLKSAVIFFMNQIDTMS